MIFAGTEEKPITGDKNGCDCPMSSFGSCDCPMSSFGKCQFDFTLCGHIEYFELNPEPRGGVLQLARLSVRCAISVINNNADHLCARKQLMQEPRSLGLNRIREVADAGQI